MNTRLLLARHGQTAWNASARFMGQLDIPMDETGRAQVRALSMRLSNERPAAIYCSDLVRARETARSIQAAIASSPPVISEPRLNEMNFGDWQGQTYAEIQQRDPQGLANWESERFHSAPPNGETLLTLAGRIQAAYHDLCAARSDQTVIVAGHGGSLQVLIVLALGLPPEAFQKLRLSNASLSELQVHETGALLLLLNDTNHLASRGTSGTPDSA
jgi:probable phosphoglycerate mutase